MTTYFFTDGACSKNNSKICERCGAGLYIIYPDERTNEGFYKTIRKGEVFKIKINDVIKEIIFDHCTNNVGELFAIVLALKQAKRLNIFNPVIVTDSKYVYGIFKSNHKVNKNVDLVNLIKFIIESYNFKINWIHVNSHQKINDTMTEEEKMLNHGNEMADKCAVTADKVVSTASKAVTTASKPVTTEN